MKKFLTIIIAIFITFTLWANETEETGEEKPPFRMKDRTWEVGLANMQIYTANDFLTTNDFFQETFVIDLDEFKKGFRYTFGLDITPLHFNFNRNNQWGFGMDLGRINAYGNLNVSGNLLGLAPAEKDEFGVGAAVFADIGIPAFLQLKKLKIKVRPAWYLPLIYTEPEVTYTNKKIKRPDGTTGIILELDYKMRFYTPYCFDPGDSDSPDSKEVMNSYKARALGFDFGAGAEYSLFSWLDLGLDFTNIPLIPSKLSYYMQLDSNLSLDTSKINFKDLIDGEDIPEDAYNVPDNVDLVHGTDDKLIVRPFKMIASADFHPFKTRILSFIPSFGFAVNSLYVKPASIEGGLKLRLDLANVFIATGGISYEDRLWKNSLDFILNVRVFEFNFGISGQSQDFAKSWQGGGVGVNIGMLFGW